MKQAMECDYCGNRYIGENENTPCSLCKGKGTVLNLEIPPAKTRIRTSAITTLMMRRNNAGA